MTVLRDIYLNVNNSTNKQQKKFKHSERTSIMLFKILQYYNFVCLVILEFFSTDDVMCKPSIAYKKNRFNISQQD